MNIKAALFDLDGVVFDTEPQYTRFWGGVFREYKPGSVDLELKIKGQTLVQIFDGYFDNPDERAAITKKLDAFERQMTFEYVDGFEAFISDLKRNGLKTCVVTSSNQEKMGNVYASHPEFKLYFDHILTSEDFSKSKPAPDCYLKGADVCGCLPSECVGFEDSYNGLRSVRGSGAFVVGLATTNSAELIAPLSDWVIKDYRGLNTEKLRQEISLFRK